MSDRKKEVKGSDRSHPPITDRRREGILNLEPYIEKEIIVKFAGGRQVIGTLKGYDPLTNLVLDNVTEHLRDPNDSSKLSGETRQLGLVICRCTSLIVIFPAEGSQEIPNPFV